MRSLRNQKELDEMFALARQYAEEMSGMPAYLCDEETWYAAVDRARMKVGDLSSNAPVCPHCGSVAPYGDERHMWISHHNSRLHKWWWRYVKRT